MSSNESAAPMSFPVQRECKGLLMVRALSGLWFYCIFIQYFEAGG